METEGASAAVKPYSIDSSHVLDIVVDMAKIEDHVYVQDIIDSIRYVMLETTDECLIGNISELYIDGRFIFIVDDTIFESVFVFDENGRFLNKIGHLGKGPAEYAGINGVAINRKAKEILIHDMKSKRVHVYSYSGDYLRSWETSFFFDDIKLTDDGHYVYSGYGEPNLHLPAFSYHDIVVSDTAFNYLYKSFRFNENASDFGHWYAFKLRDMNDSEIIYAPRFANRVYAFGGDSMALKCRFQFNGGTVVDRAVFDRYGYRELEHFLETEPDAVFFDGTFSETNTHIFFSCYNGKRHVNGLFDTSSDNCRLFGGYALGFNEVPFFRSPLTQVGDWFVSDIPVADIVSKKHKLISASFKAFFKQVDERSNPVLAFYRFKQF